MALTIAIGKTAFHDVPEVGTLAGVIVATNPQFLNLLNTSDAGLLTKLSIGPVAVATCVCLGVRTVALGNYRMLLRGTIATTVIVTAGAGWRFQRNHVLYGDPVGWNVFANR
ncbi:MAG: hypothetical protein LC118_13725 [Dehalococcoidia bacterium]|nr:hypothetical protein [Dehalococcoidia bacterium]